MTTVWILARRELRALFDHPTGYILLVVFLAVNDFLFFRQAYLTGTASLRPMLDLLPWVFLFFIPAATMRAVAEDARSGTLEVVLAQPVTEAELLAGKYVGQLIFIWLALALTMPVALGLSLGADLQVGVMVAQYVGSALLAAGLAAVGLWASSITANQITAFIVGVAVMFVLILVGANPLVTGLPPGLSAIIANLSVLPHFENIARGVIDLRDAIYFAALAGVFLALAYLAIMGRKLSAHRDTRKRLRLGTVLIAIILILVNLFGRHIGGRLDLTPGKAYTLSGASKALLSGLDDLVTIKLFVSEKLPPEIAIVKRDIGDLLADVRAAGGGNVRVVELDPAGDSEAESEARSLGIPPVQFNVIGEAELQVQEGYLGMAVQYADGTETIPFVQRTDDLEYRLVSYIRSLTRTDRPVVGFVEPPVDARGPAFTFRTLRQELERNYEVRTLSVSDSGDIADDVSLLVLAGVQPFLDTLQQERFKAFLKRGGGALVMARGMALDLQGLMASARPVSWNTVVQPYGVSIRADLVYDLASNEMVSVPAGGMRVFTSYPYWLRALSTRETPINRGVEAIMLPWASTIDTTGATPGTVTPLFTSSRAGGVEIGRAFVAPRREFPTDSLAPRLVAALVNPLAADSVGEYRGRLVLVGNEEFVSDRPVSNSAAGLDFALNAVDWLAQDDALIQIRSKSRRPPPLVFESGTTRDFVKYGNVAGMPLLLIIFASARLWRRRVRTRETYRSPKGAGSP